MHAVLTSIYSLTWYLTYLCISLPLSYRVKLQENNREAVFDFFALLCARVNQLLPPYFSFFVAAINHNIFLRPLWLLESSYQSECVD